MTLAHQLRDVEERSGDLSCEEILHRDVGFVSRVVGQRNRTPDAGPTHTLGLAA